MNTTLKNQKNPIYSSRKIILRIIEQKGINELIKRITLNLQDLLKMLEWNEENGIKVFRLSSELFMHKTNPKAPNYTYDFAKPLLKQIGEYANKHNHRLTFHPGQYNVLGTPHEKYLKQTIKDLQYHADILDLMYQGKNSVMVIHGGGIYDDKNKTMDRWCERYNNLPDKIKNRLVLENCEKIFSIEDCLYVNSKTAVPIVFDTHHFDCYCKLHPDEFFKSAEYYIPLILDTWYQRNIKPKFHVSEQGTGKIGKHSDYIQNIPKYLLDIPYIYGISIDIMIEAKMKEKSIHKLYDKYPNLNCKINLESFEIKQEIENILN